MYEMDQQERERERERKRKREREREREREKRQNVIRNSESGRTSFWVTIFGHNLLRNKDILKVWQMSEETRYLPVSAIKIICYEYY